MLGTQTCTHVPDTHAEPRASNCEGCGSSYNLRVCISCGHVGCCESQRAHNRAHFQASGHPVIRSMPVNDSSFTWCYECRRYV